MNNLELNQFSRKILGEIFTQLRKYQSHKGPPNFNGCCVPNCWGHCAKSLGLHGN